MKRARTVVATALLAVSLAAGTARAQDPTAPPPPPERRTVAQLPLNLARGAIGLFHVDNLRPLAIACSEAPAGFLMDRPVAVALSHPQNRFGQSFEIGAKPWVSGSLVAAVFVTGRFAGSPTFRAASYDWVHASLLTAGYTELLKDSVRRLRPNGADSNSFPSGHASNAFALAAVAERHWGWKAGLPAYGLAAAVALSRLQRNAHYLSDVMAGATLGYLVGRTVVRVNGGPAGTAKSPRVAVSPVVGRRTRAVRVEVAF